MRSVVSQGESGKPGERGPAGSVGSVVSTSTFCVSHLVSWPLLYHNVAVHRVLLAKMVTSELLDPLVLLYVTQLINLS